MKALWDFFTSRFGAGMLSVLALALFLGWGAVTLRDSTRQACDRDHEQARLAGVEAQMDATLDEIERGDQISARLAQTQRRLYETKTAYLAYANGIAGNCPADLGVFLAAESAGHGLPETSRPSADPAATVAAAVIAANIAENRGRFEANFAQCAALVEFHTKPEKALKDE